MRQLISTRLSVQHRQNQFAFNYVRDFILPRSPIAMVAICVYETNLLFPNLFNWYSDSDSFFHPLVQSENTILFFFWFRWLHLLTVELYVCAENCMKTPDKFIIIIVCMWEHNGGLAIAWIKYLSIIIWRAKKTGNETASSPPSAFYGANRLQLFEIKCMHRTRSNTNYNTTTYCAHWPNDNCK